MNRIGLCFLDRPDPRRQVALAQRSEAVGFESIWVCETRTARDAVSVLGAMSYATSRIRLAPGVVNSWTRPASLMALTFATLDELAPERMMLGLGAYWDPLAWKQGIVRSKPLRQMREYVDVVRRLLTLETISFEGEFVQARELRLELGDGVELKPKSVPIYLGATGPKMLELAGEIADGVLLNAYTSVGHQADSLARVSAGAARVGRSLADLDLPQIVAVAMDSRSPAQAKQVARYMATMYLGQQPHIGLASGMSAELLRRVQETMGGWPPRPNGIVEAMPLVPMSTVDALVVSGGPEECVEGVRKYVTSDNVYPVLMPLTDNYEEMVEVFAAGA